MIKTIFPPSLISRQVINPFTNRATNFRRVIHAAPNSCTAIPLLFKSLATALSFFLLPRCFLCDRATVYRHSQCTSILVCEEIEEFVLEHVVRPARHVARSLRWTSVTSSRVLRALVNLVHPAQRRVFSCATS